MGGVGQVVQPLGARLEVAAPPLVEPNLGAAQSLTDVRDRSAAEAKGDGTLACREVVVHGYLRGAAAGGFPRRSLYPDRGRGEGQQRRASAHNRQQTKRSTVASQDRKLNDQLSVKTKRSAVGSHLRRPDGAAVSVQPGQSNH